MKKKLNNITVCLDSNLNADKLECIRVQCLSQLVHHENVINCIDVKISSPGTPLKDNPSLKSYLYEFLNYIDKLNLQDVDYYIDLNLRS